MNRALKALVVIEVFVCFSPALVLLFLGIMVIPNSFIAHPDVQNLGTLVTVAGGLCGLVGALMLANLVVSGTPSRSTTRGILVLAAIGAASLLPIVVGAVDSFRWRLIGLLPILASLHLIYLARTHLFGYQAPSPGESGDV